jgi:hypothetical protein
VKFAPVVILGVIAGASMLMGCQHEMTLEDARALCTKQGGLLVVFYSQKLTTSGIGPQVASPGDCLSPSKFDVKPAASLAASDVPFPTSSDASTPTK